MVLFEGWEDLNDITFKLNRDGNTVPLVKTLAGNQRKSNSLFLLPKEKNFFSSSQNYTGQYSFQAAWTPKGNKKDDRLIGQINVIAFSRVVAVNDFPIGTHYTGDMNFRVSLKNASVIEGFFLIKKENEKKYSSEKYRKEGEVLTISKNLQIPGQYYIGSKIKFRTEQDFKGKI